MFEIIIISIAIVLCFAAGIFMMVTKKGAWLIAGYNTASKEEKKKYDARALTRFFGIILVATGVFLSVALVGTIVASAITSLIAFVCILILLCFAIIFSNASKRFKSK